MAIRRSPKFRFDYFLRSLPVDVLGRRCEHLMRVAVKEIEDLENKARETLGLTTDAEHGKELPQVELSSYKDLMDKDRARKKEQTEKERSQLEQNVEELEKKMKTIQDRLKELSRDIHDDQYRATQSKATPLKKHPRLSEKQSGAEEEEFVPENSSSALGPDGNQHQFPDYDGSEEPHKPRKAFQHFCKVERVKVKHALDPSERQNKEKVNDILKERWLELSDEDKQPWRIWASWDKKRYARDLAVYERIQGGSGGAIAQSSKKRPGDEGGNIPKKKRK